MAKSKAIRHRHGSAGERRPKSGPDGPARGRNRGGSRRTKTAERAGSAVSLWLYGTHPVLAALANPRRRLERLVLSPEAAQTWGQRLRQQRDPAHAHLILETRSRREIDELLPEGAVHQGLAVKAPPLDQPSIEDIAASSAPTGDNPAGDNRKGPNRRVILLLDQVSDPHNVGAVLRSAAAFGAEAVVALDARAPDESGSLAKAASGALEVMPYIKVTNLARSLDSLKIAGYWCIGLSGDAEQSLAAWNPADRVALVLGAEGSGLRRLTRERCDLLAKLPTRPPIQALNISNAAAVALYELLGRN